MTLHDMCVAVAAGWAVWLLEDIEIQFDRTGYIIRLLPDIPGLPVK